MVNAPKKDHSPLPAGKYSNPTKQSTCQRHQANEGMSGYEADRVSPLEAVCSLCSKKKLSAVRRWEMCFLSNKENEKWITDYVDRETAVARKRVQDAETAIMQEQEDLRNA